MSQVGDTILALASPPGRGARGVVRLSGPRSLEIARSVFSARREDDASETRRARVLGGSLALPSWPEVPARLWLFRKGRSYTGEDSCELHVSGSPPLLAALVSALARAGARPAAPGEFTRRAFLNGRLDLAQAEAVLALTRAEADGEARAAARALLGGLRAAIDRSKEAVLGVLAHVEATIDFPEDDLPGLDPASALAERCEKTAEEIAALDRRSLAPGVVRGEATVVLSGKTNAGKSTLLNALAGREAAIVSPLAGTTRDAVSVEIDLDGRRVRLVDTAGEKEASGEIEREALARARDATRTADLVLHLVDSTTLASTGSPSSGSEAPSLVVVSKLDLLGASDRAKLETAGLSCMVSALTGEGMKGLRSRIGEAIERDPGLSPDLIQTERQARLASGARDALARAAGLLRSREPARLELAAVDLRSALQALGELTGAVATDDLLDRIFGEFCVGK
ncbi:tRNA uridine-5-carboxymethylaminomethyl(34) synthesis GTPase MnmE [bacterium]|nr:tRNA uridine-5-carboxymethylaminomethyl(34) synthesis GTPase MnmE [bacterium]